MTEVATQDDASTESRGRPAATSRSEIEHVAFKLFAQHGFDNTTITMIAERLGVSRRTVTRYFLSKNDIPWGHFDSTLPRFDEILAATSPDQPLWARVHEGVVEFNHFPDDANPSHRSRMQVILQTPSLQAHAVLRHQQWRQAVERFVAGQLGAQAADSPLPRLVGQVSMALATASYGEWLATGSSTHDELVRIMNRSMSALRGYLEAAPTSIEG